MIHEAGLEPDIVTEMNPEDLYKIRVRQMYPNGSFPEPSDSSPEVRDVQLEKAVGVLQGVLLFNPSTR